MVSTATQNQFKPTCNYLFQSFMEFIEEDWTEFKTYGHLCYKNDI